MAVAVLAAGLAHPGCAPEAPTFDPSTRYNSDSLAEAFLLRYRALKRPAPTVAASGQVARKGRDRAARKAPAPVPAKVSEEARAKAGDATKKAAAATLDDLIADIAAKAGSIPGTSRREALGRVAASVTADPSVDEADREHIRAELGRLGAGR
jgi:hypothetical protein